MNRMASQEMPSEPGKKQVLSVSFAPPDRLASHAGRQYVYRHLQVLSHQAKVTCYTEGPRSRVNDTSLPNGVELHFLEASPSWENLTLRVLTRIRRLYNPWQLTAALLHSFRSNSALKSEIQAASLVEVQWVEYYNFAKTIRRWNPSVMLIGVSHDVASQRVAREQNGETGGIEGFLSKQLVLRALFTERRLMRHFDRIVVFSDKDRLAIEKTGSSTPVSVIHPALEEPGMPHDGRRYTALRQQTLGQKVIFVANFERPVNREGALWLLAQVWPIVSDKLRNAELYLVGNGSKELLQDQSQDQYCGNGPASIGGIRATGFIDDISPYYKTAHVAVAPLLKGAGVKFKTISAMMWGVPVVSTPVGAEGIGNTEHYLAITSDPVKFASAVVSGLADARLATKTAERALDFSRHTYSDHAFASAVQRIYQADSP